MGVNDIIKGVSWWQWVRNGQWWVNIADSCFTVGGSGQQ